MRTVPSGVLLRKTADIYPADEKWAVAIVINAPTPPPLKRWKDEAYHLFYSGPIRNFIPNGEWNTLFKMVDHWNFEPLRLTHATILNATRSTGDSQGPASRVRCGLFDFIGDVSNALFATATEEEVVALQDGIRAIAEQESAVYHKQFRLLSVMKTLINELDLRSVLRHLRGTPMPLGWYYAFTPVRPVTISNEQIVFAADIWSRSTDAYEE